MLLVHLSHRDTNQKRVRRAQGCRMVFPPGDKEAVEVTAADLARLDPGEFLNDTVIDYYIKCASDQN